MRRIFLLLTLILVCSQAEAANRYIRATGGNYNSAGTWELTAGGGESVAVPTASDDVIGVAGSGQLTITANAVAQSVDLSAYTNTLTHNGFSWTVSGNITFGAGMTYSPLSTATITPNANCNLTTAGLLMPNINLITAGATTLQDNLTFMDAKTIFIQGTSGQTRLILNGQTLSGFSATSRVQVRATTLGSATTINNTTGTFANADFRDITFSTAADYSAISGLAGDCGGNTNGTFTTAATQTWDGTTGNWSDATKWTSRVPLPQDDVVIGAFGAASRTLTIDMPRWGKDIDASGVTNTPTITKSVDGTLYGSMELASGLTWTSAAFRETFEGRGTHFVTSAGKAHNRATFASVGGSYTLLDAFSSASETLNFSNVASGMFDANDFDVTGFQISFSNNTQTINMGNGTWTNTRNTTNGWNMTALVTLNAEGSTIVMQNGGFLGAGKTYNNLTYSASGTGLRMNTGNNTFNVLTINGPTTVSFTSGGTQTITDFVRSVGTDVITLNSLTPGSAATITKTSSIVEALDYLHITDINVTPASTWYYGNNSTYVSGTGWNAGFPGGAINLPLLGVG